MHQLHLFQLQNKPAKRKPESGQKSQEPYKKMTESMSPECELLLLLDRHEGLLQLGGAADFGAKFGVVLSLRGRPLGLWSHGSEQFIFRDLSSYAPVFAAASIEEAVEFSLQLLQTCKNGWAERLGALPRRGRAA